uniref:Uncharacterized protein n=1 Tax=Globodera rostochiensis TaxID=31243 RepID=A0A914I254_GLORO
MVAKNPDSVGSDKNTICVNCHCCFPSLQCFCCPFSEKRRRRAACRSAFCSIFNTMLITVLIKLPKIEQKSVG